VSAGVTGDAICPLTYSVSPAHTAVASGEAADWICFTGVCAYAGSLITPHIAAAIAAVPIACLHFISTPVVYACCLFAEPLILAICTRCEIMLIAR